MSKLTRWSLTIAVSATLTLLTAIPASAHGCDTHSDHYSSHAGHLDYWDWWSHYQQFGIHHEVWNNATHDYFLDNECWV